MPSPFSGVGDSLFKLAQIKSQRQQSQYDDLIKQAQLKEMGYDIAPGQGGGYTLTQEPGTVSMKALQRQKLQNELDPNYEANRAALKEKALFGVRKEMFGDGASNVGNGQFIMTPDGKFVLNPATPKPLNALQQAQLQDRQIKQQDADKLKATQDENLKSSAQDSIDTIEKVKEGSKYFGPLGDLPSKMAPSSLMPGEYGKRAEWEANVNNLLSKKVIEVMNNMKKASKTGATGFGALNKSELDLLKNSSSVINRNLTPDVAVKYLNDLENVNKKILTGGNKFGTTNQENGQPNQVNSGNQENGNPEMEKPGGVLHVDAKGNKAIVYPDGTFKEIQ